MLLLMYFGGAVDAVTDELEQFGDNVEYEERVGQLHGVVAIGETASLCAGPFKVHEVLRGLNLLFIYLIFFSYFLFFSSPFCSW